MDPVQNIVAPLGIVGLDVTPASGEADADLRRPAGVVVAARRRMRRFRPPLEVGDVIYSVNRQTVASIAQLRDVMKGLKNGDPAVLLIERNSHLMYLPLQPE